MNITNLNSKSVCILGYGREGKAMVEALEKHAPHCKITIADSNEELRIENDAHRKQLGKNWLTDLETFDCIITSPGIPPAKIPDTKTPITNSTQVFLDSIDPRATVIGVTGSKGKSTTASLLHHILKAAGKKPVLVGNIGTPAIANLEEINEHSIVVLEMSSYQLLRVNRSPQVAIITSFFPEHLDYHGSLEAYKNAKEHITKFQTPDDFVFYYEHSEGATDIASASAGIKQPYNDANSPIAVQDTKLLGTHNLLNIAGAAVVARHFGITDDTIAKAAQTFVPLAHRLQYVGTQSGIHWVDDAISTTPESTIAAIAALSPRVRTVILGGQDRGNDFSQLGEMLSTSGIKTVILMGESGPRIKNAITDPDIVVHEASTMAEAVQITKEHTKTVSEGIPVCLLSPASPSYGMYKNFEEKGLDFANAIKN